MTDGFKWSVPWHSIDFYEDARKSIVNGLIDEAVKHKYTNFSKFPKHRAPLLRQSLTSLIKARDDMYEVERDLEKEKGDERRVCFHPKTLDLEEEYNSIVLHVNDCIFKYKLTVHWYSIAINFLKKLI